MKSFEVAKRKVITRMQAFKSSCITLIKLSLGESISFADTRVELVRVVAQYKKLREEVADVELGFFALTHAKLVARFMELVGEELRMCKEEGLA